jgi:hypothetical protein
LLNVVRNGFTNPSRLSATRCSTTWQEDHLGIRV